MIKSKTCRRKRIHIRADEEGKLAWIIEHHPMNLGSPFFFDKPEEAFRDAREYIKTFITKEKELDLEKVHKKFKRKRK